jgi:tRNA uridine 5-carboxymethylaminomethyl modification enzyme
MSNLENLSIPESFNYDKLTAMSAEARQKLNKIKPATLGQASRISGVNPSDVQILMVYMGR